MTVGAPDRGASLARRLERYRAATAGGVPRPDRDDLLAVPGTVLDGTELAERLAVAVDGEVVRVASGLVVRREVPSRPIAVDRERLASLPGQPPPDVPLICLDTETTGLATAAGTVAFLIGLGRWDGDRFQQVQLLLPDHAHEAALLAELAAFIPPDAWLVTYNGRGFDWPLLETRYRMARRGAPAIAGHLDLLPVVRRLFRHRLTDARLKTAETGLLGMHRHGDVDGWEIPARYLGFLRGGPVLPLVDVVRHNDQDVRSLARLLVLLERDYVGSARRGVAPAGDLAGLARAYARLGRLTEALDCYDDALEGPLDQPAPSGPRAPIGPPSLTGPPSPPGTPSGPHVARERAPAQTPEPWWSPRSMADFGGRPRPPRMEPARTEAFPAPWSTERIAVERAYLLRRLGRFAEAVEAWHALAAGPGRTAVVATIELAKLHEHRLRDPAAALAMTANGLRLAERRRHIGRPEPRLEADLTRRATRLRRRLRSRRVEPRADLFQGRDGRRAGTLDDTRRDSRGEP
jgi:hypothetical protein